MINHFLLVMLTLASLSSSAQCVVSGHVLDAKTKAPLPFATLSDLDTHAQVAADEKGFFELEGSCTAHVLKVQFIGYESLIDTVLFSQEAHVDLLLTQSAVAVSEVTIAEQGRTSVLPFVPMQKLEPSTFSNGLNQHASDLFSSVKGVSSINTGTNSGQPAIRGLFGSRVGIIVDGVPQQNQQWGVDHGLDIDPWLIQKFAVHKTGGGLLFGPSASAGAIEVETLPQLSQKEMKCGLVMRGLSATKMGEGALTLSKRWNYLQLFAAASARTYADYRVPAESFEYLDRTFTLNEGQLVNTSGNSNGQQLGALWEKNSRSIHLILRRSTQAFGIFSGIFGIPSQTELLGDADERRVDLPKMTSTHSSGTVQVSQSFAHSKLKFTAAYQLSERTEQGEAHVHGNGPLPSSDLALELSLRTLFFDLNWTEFDLKKNKLFFKAQAEFQNSTSDGWEFLLSDYAAANIGAMGGMKMDVWNGRLNLGVRADFNQLEVQSFAEPTYSEVGEVVGSSERAPQVKKQFLMWGANVNYSTTIDATKELQFILARTVRSANAYESAANGVHHGTFRHEKGNPNLTPEVGYVADLQYSKANSWLVNPFFGYYSNFIFLAPSAQFSTLPEAGQLYQFRQSEVIRYGVEAVFEYAIRRYDFELSGEYVNGQVLDEGTALPWTPPLRVSAQIKRSWNLRNENQQLYIAPRLEVFSAQNQVFRNEDPTPGYQLLNCSLGYTKQLRKHSIEAIAFVTNALNTRYINHMSRYKILNLPEVGRNIGITLNFKF